MTVVDSHVELVEDIQRRLKKQEKYRGSCSAVAGSNTVQTTPEDPYSLVANHGHNDFLRTYLGKNFFSTAYVKKG